MKCSATKRKGLPCTFKAKVNGRCGFQKVSKPSGTPLQGLGRPIPKPRGIPLQRPTPKPRVKKTALDEQPNRPIPKPRTKQQKEARRPTKQAQLILERMEDGTSP